MVNLQFKRILVVLVLIISFTGFTESYVMCSSDNSIEGVWQREGYGMVLECARGKVTVYEITSVSGIKIDEGTYFDNMMQFVSDSEIVKFQYTIENGCLTIRDDSDMYFIAKRLEELPEHCRNGGMQASNDPELNFNIFWQTFNEQYAFFQLRGVNWDTQYQLYRSQVAKETTSLQLFEIMCKMVEPLQDAHVSIEGLGSECRKMCAHLTALIKNLGLEEQKRFKNLSLINLIVGLELKDPKIVGLLQGLIGELSPVERRIVELIQDEHVLPRFPDGDINVLNAELLKDDTDVSNVQLVLSYRNGMSIDVFYHEKEFLEKRDTNLDLGDNIGLITIDSEGGDLNEKAEKIDEAIKNCANKKTIIIDVRINEGGRDLISRLYAGRFADQKRLAYSKQARAGNYFTPLRDFYVEPQGPRQYMGKVIVLTSPNTVSAGEIFVMCMKALPNVTVIGDRTNGVYSDILERDLPNGWSLGLPNERYFAADGHCYEKIGVQPDIYIPFDFDEIMRGKDRIMERALEYAQR
jgi:carboxyl-terminal processing protease